MAAETLEIGKGHMVSLFAGSTFDENTGRHYGGDISQCDLFIYCVYMCDMTNSNNIVYLEQLTNTG